ncbi:MAG: serine/threonine protein kinase [Phycisphaerales bacterium]|nr:MAG: serine/threonine protein kinase [Phycisphaerales bacterium]
MGLLNDLDAAGAGLLDAATGGAGVLAAELIRDTGHRGEGVGSLIGAYKLLEQIGEGGFGLVYMAQQEQPIRRRVALKIIKLGLETGQVIARFEQERQALAMMDHPHIAKVLDAGATPAGRPYFVMELVRGEPITTFCDNNKLTIPQRLELFAKVCLAVQHAHQKGIIHRDLKPSNVLVTVGDGDTPVPKVIDFGIAKATEARLTERTLFTEFRQMIGTPAYMSPEQAGMGAAGGLDIDTRSDVYALGALLYELLTGVTPFDATRLRSAAFGELQRMIREDDPPRPSTRLSTEATIADVAARRQIDPKRLGLLVRGELDWVVMRCLEKDRARRYASADDLARDLNRYLMQEPLEAGPPTAAYRLRKFVRRHRRPVAAGSVLAVALVLGLVGTSMAAAWALRERDRARDSEIRAIDSRREAEALAEVASAERARAEAAAVIEADLRSIAVRETESNRAVTEFLTGVLSLANPAASGRPDITVRELLIGAEEQMPNAMAGQPKAEGKVRLAMGLAYLGMSELERSEQMLRRAAALLNEHAPEDLWHRYHAHIGLTDATVELQIATGDDITSALRLGAVLVGDRYPETARGMEELIEGFKLRQITRVRASGVRLVDTANTELAPGDPLWEPVAKALWLAGAAMYETRRYQDAVELMTTVNAWAKDIPSIGETVRASWRLELGMSLAGTGRLEEADVMIRDTLDYLENTVHVEHIFLAVVRGLRGRNLLALGRDEEAVSFLRQACAYTVRTGTLFIEGGEAFAACIATLERMGLAGEAAELRAVFAVAIGADRGRVAWDSGRAAFAPERQGLADAAEAYRDAQSRADGSDQSNAEIRSRFEELLGPWRASRDDAPAESVLIALYVALWADIYERPDRAIRVRACEEALAALTQAGVTQGRGVIAVHRELHKYAMAEGRYGRAEEMARIARRASRELWGEHYGETTLTTRELASAIAMQGLFDKAEPMLLGALADTRANSGDSFATRVAFRELLRLYTSTGRTDKVIPHLRDAAVMFGDIETGISLQDDQIDRDTPGLCLSVLGLRSPALAEAVSALLSATADDPAASDDVEGLVAAVLRARADHGPVDEDPAAIAYASLLVALAQRVNMGDSAALVPLVEDARRVAHAQVGPLAWLSIRADRRLIELLLRSGRPAEAESWAQAHADGIRAAFGAGSVSTNIGEVLLARAILDQSRNADALDLLEAFYPSQAAISHESDETKRSFAMLLRIAAADPSLTTRAIDALGTSLAALQTVETPLRADYAWMIARQPALPATMYETAQALASAKSDDEESVERAALARGAASYRLGRYAESVATLLALIDAGAASVGPGGIPDATDPEVSATARIVVAMALHAAGDAPGAGREILVAQRLFDQAGRPHPEPALLAEARAVLSGG